MYIYKSPLLRKFFNKFKIVFNNKLTSFFEFTDLYILLNNLNFAKLFRNIFTTTKILKINYVYKQTLNWIKFWKHLCHFNYSLHFRVIFSSAIFINHIQLLDYNMIMYELILFLDQKNHQNLNLCFITLLYFNLQFMKIKWM